MQYDSTIRFDSEVIPGVWFDVHKPSYGRKIEFDTLNCEYRARVREISKQHRKLRADYDALVQEHSYEIERQVRDIKKSLGEARDEDMAAVEARIAELEASEPEIDPALIEKMEDLGEESVRLTHTLYNPARLRWGLAAIDGLKINGEAATVETLIKSGPYELTMEILAVIDNVSALSSEKLKNLPSPTTFSALVAATVSSTTASAVLPVESTEIATASE